MRADDSVTGDVTLARAFGKRGRMPPKIRNKKGGPCGPAPSSHAMFSLRRRCSPVPGFRLEAAILRL